MAAVEDAAATGRSVADLAKENLNGHGDAANVEPPEAGVTDDDDDDGTPQLIIPGTGAGLTTQVGGRKPTESFFQMGRVALPIAGGVELKKDAELWIAVPVAIDSVLVRNRRKDGNIASTARFHTGIPIGQPIVLDGPPGGPVAAG